MRIRINYSIIFVSDMEHSVRFYRDVVGIPLKFESPGWTEFDTDGATLALHKSDAPALDSETQNAEPQDNAVLVFRFRILMNSTRG